MLWMPFGKFLILGLVSACASTPSGPGTANTAQISAGDREAVLILFMSDFHSQLRPDSNGRGGYAQIKKWIDHERAEAGWKTDVVVIGGGDMMGKGSIPCQETNDKECVSFLKDMGFNYSTLGNYELYNNIGELTKLIQSTGATFVGMNVNGGKGAWSSAPVKFKGVKSGLEFYIGSWTAPADVKGYSIRPSPSASDWASWKRQLNAPVLWLSHQEMSKDVDFARDACAALSPQVQQLAILKANDHNVMQKDVTQCAPILEPGPFGRYALKLLLTRDTQNPNRLKTETAFVEISGKGEDSAMRSRIDALYQRYAPNANEVVFTADREISKEAIAQWMADAYRGRMKAEAAIYNLGAVKNAVPSGPVTREMLYTTLPHNNQLVGLDWSVADMESALCAASKRALDSDLDHGSELFFSGFKLENPGTAQCKVVAPKRSLKVVVDSYMNLRSERWLGRSLKTRTFSFGVDSRRVTDLQLKAQLPAGAR